MFSLHLILRFTYRMRLSTLVDVMCCYYHSRAAILGYVHQVVPNAAKSNATLTNMSSMGRTNGQDLRIGPKPEKFVFIYLPLSQYWINSGSGLIKD